MEQNRDSRNLEIYVHLTDNKMHAEEWAMHSLFNIWDWVNWICIKKEKKGGKKERKERNKERKEVDTTSHHT